MCSSAPVKAFTAHECSPGGSCPFTITIHNDAATAPFSGSVAIRDQDTPGGLQIQSVTPPLCLPLPTATPFDCEANVQIPAGGSQVLTFDAYMPFAANGQAPNELENCVSGGALLAPTGTSTDWPEDLFAEEQENCAKVNYCGFACHAPPEVTDKLTLAKTLKNDETCVPGGVCSYEISISNLGNSAVTGPLTMQEHVPAGGTITTVSALPWSCGPVLGGFATCAHPTLTLQPGEMTSFTVDVAIPNDFSGSEIANCAGFHGDASPLAAARALSNTAPTGLTSLFARPEGYSQDDLAAYLQIRGLAPDVAQSKAAKFVGQVKSNGTARQGQREMSCAVKTLATEQRLDLEKTCDVVDAIPGAPLVIRCTITLSGTGQIAFEPWEYDTPMTNCADASLRRDAQLASQSCATLIVPKPGDTAAPQTPVDDTVNDDPVPPLTIGTPELVVSKTASQACRINRAAQTYWR